MFVPPVSLHETLNFEAKNAMSSNEKTRLARGDPVGMRMVLQVSRGTGRRDSTAPGGNELDKVPRGSAVHGAERERVSRRRRLRDS